ncbi:CoA-transferase subunit beta [Permianibacter sp. IMCC34836]|nr:CoA-transferase subunit beta [Permianibacter fluminis]
MNSEQSSGQNSVPNYSRDEIMTVTAARQLQNSAVCFVGIGLPSAACNLARQTHAPELVLIYESGTVGTKPSVLPLSIGDGELAETADCVIPLPDIFSYYLQGGRVDIGFLGAAQIDRFGNLNSTVIGDYLRPSTRLPGAGGAPEIAMHAKQVLIVMKQSPRSFVESLGFRTSCGFMNGNGQRRHGEFADASAGAGPQVVITDYGMLKPDPVSDELTLVAVYPGVTAAEVSAATGWSLRIAPTLTVLPEPTAAELSALRSLHARTEQAHANPVRIVLPKTA